MRKRCLTSLIVLMLSSLLHAGWFSGYDFTYFNSVAPTSLGAMDAQKLGLDFTGYGFLGKMTGGIYVRLGIQSPYTTIMRLFEEEEKPDAPAPDPAIRMMRTTADVPKEDPYEFKVLFSFGPAFRRFISPTLSWYMGTGIMVEQDRKILPVVIDTVEDRAINTRSTVAFDLDFGFRLSTHEHSTMRIGIYLTRQLFILTEDRYGSEEPEFTFDQNIFTPIDGKLPLDVSGYISLGHTYMSDTYTDVYRYVITGREYGKGTYEKIS